MSAAPDETVELLRLFDSHSLQSCLRDVIRARRLRMHLHARGLSLSLSLSAYLSDPIRTRDGVSSRRSVFQRKKMICNSALFARRETDAYRAAQKSKPPQNRW